MFYLAAAHQQYFRVWLYALVVVVQVKAIRNLNGHSIGPYQIHAGVPGHVTHQYDAPQPGGGGGVFVAVHRCNLICG
jgi:methionine aminopeptidase